MYLFVKKFRGVTYPFLKELIVKDHDGRTYFLLNIWVFLGSLLLSSSVFPRSFEAQISRFPVKLRHKISRTSSGSAFIHGLTGGSSLDPLDSDP